MSSSKNKLQNFRNYEIIITLSFWLLLLLAPILFGRFQEEIDWPYIFRTWLERSPLIAVFLINRFILLPNLLFKEKQRHYIMAAGFLIFIIFIATYTYERTHSNKFKPDRTQPIEKVRPPHLPPHLKQVIHPLQKQQVPFPYYANILILSILIIGFDAGLGISSKYMEKEKQRSKLEKENIDNQLAFLRNQVSPHFFMNTLNNIHALIDIDTEEAKDSVIKLSQLMRHLLYDSEAALLPLSKEINFIKNYIELMRLRYTYKVKVNLNLPDNLPDKKIPPLLFISFLENAFKHGISYRIESKINIILWLENKKLFFHIQNTNPNEVKIDNDSGIGLENARKRLDLLYAQNYQLDIKEEHHLFTVNLSIPL